MLGKNISRKFFTLVTVAAVWCVYSMVALAMPVDQAGEITVTGQVTVNGQTAVSNSTIISGSTIVTGADSSAVVSLGKLGRVEVLADSNLVLNFSDSSIVGSLQRAKLAFRMQPVSPRPLRLKTRQPSPMPDRPTISWSRSSVRTLTLTRPQALSRCGSARPINRLRPDTSATAGNLSQTGCKPCLRPNSAPAGRRWLPWLILLGGGGCRRRFLLGTGWQ